MKVLLIMLINLNDKIIIFMLKILPAKLTKKLYFRI